jgi:hypothetical protein
MAIGGKHYRDHFVSSGIDLMKWGPQSESAKLLGVSRKSQIFAAMFFCGILLSYAFVAPRLFNSAVRGYSDFSNFYTAGKIVQMGQGHQLYDLPWQTHVQSQFSEAARLRNRALFYMRPPFEALLFLPLSYLPFARAYEVWVVLSIVIVGVTAGLLRLRILELRVVPWWLYYPAFFSFCPIAYGFATGQDHALIVFLFSMVMMCLFEERDFRAGCFLGLALIKFQIVLPLVLVLFLKRKFRTLAGFSAVAVLLFGAGVAVVGWEGMKGYPAYLLQLNQVPAASAIYPSMMPSLRGLVQGWGDPTHSSPILDMLTGLISLAVLIFASRRWHTAAPRGSKLYTAGISIVFLATLLAGYHAFVYDLSFLVPIALLAANSGLQDRGFSAHTRSALLLGAAALLCAPLHLLLIGKMKVNLMAVAVLVLLWGYASAIRTWQRQGTQDQGAQDQEKMSGSVHSVAL